jgi:hypothetical protein
MATKTATKTTTTTTGKPAPAPVASASNATQAAQGSKAAQAAVPQAPLYTVGTLPPVRPGTHRAYAQGVFKSLAKSHPKGFTLAQAKAAHNMPTWASHANQGWLVPVTK